MGFESLQNEPFQGPKRAPKRARGVKVGGFRPEGETAKDARPFLATPRPFGDPSGASSWPPEGAFWEAFWNIFLEEFLMKNL